MAFSKKQIPQYPKRHWQIVGRAGSGKSTFAMRMKAPLLPIDADHRIDQVAHLNPDMLELSTTATDHNDTDRIAALLAANMPGAQVGTIVIDSLTAIIAPLVTQALQDKEHGRAKNLYAAFRAKAMAMRQLQDAVTRWGTDTLWIFHLDDTNTESGEKIVKETISKTELARLMRSVNLKLEVVADKENPRKRGIWVKWARRGRSGKQVGILWDETGTWIGMPERVERAVYDGLTVEEQDAIENSLPASFDDEATAIAWGLEKGAFNALEHARNAYEKLMRENEFPGDKEERAALWIADVLARLEEKHANGNGHGSGHTNGSKPVVAPAPTSAAAPSDDGDDALAGPTEFWKRVNATKFNRDNAQVILKAYTLDGRTDWGGALREINRQVNSGAGR